MVIKASAGKAIDSLVADLSSDAPVKRDAAIARLTVIGGRAVERLIALAARHTAPPGARVAAFRALEGIADPRALPSALSTFTHTDPDIVIAALGVARLFLRSPSHGMQALDQVTAVGLDAARPASVRLVAIRALADLEPSTVKPIVAALKADPNPEFAAVFDPPVRKSWAGAGQRKGAVPRLKDAVTTLPPNPDGLRRAIAREAGDATPEVLQQLIERVRVREGGEPVERRAAWMAVRAAAHLVLADRGSRVALYDLRETIESAKGPLAVEFLAALTSIGDATCLDPIVAAYTRSAKSGASPDDWWRRHLADAFQAIAAREKIGARHAAVKRMRDALSTTSRTTPRTSPRGRT